MTAKILKYSFIQDKTDSLAVPPQMLGENCQATGARPAIVLYIIKESSLRVYRGYPLFCSPTGVGVTKIRQKPDKYGVKRDK